MTTEFLSLAKFVSKNLGVPNLCLVVVSHPIGGISQEEVDQKVDAVFPDLLKAATLWGPQTREINVSRGQSKKIRFTGTYSDLNQWFFEHGLSLGLPIVPPTIHAVEAMLKGTSRKAEEVVWERVPPRMGLLTVEAVAICAAMAGCRPEFLPIILAAMEAFRQTDSHWTHMQVTTGTESPLIIINGPIIQELNTSGEKIGIAYATEAAGPGHLANVAIGYAIGLISYVVGGAKPGIHAMSTLGSPAETIAYVFAENEDALPFGWPSYATEKGFRSNDSVVSVKVTYPAIDVSDHESRNAAQHLNYWAHSINIPYTLIMPPNVVVALSPEHAQLLASEGWTKEKIRQYLWEHARYPYNAIPSSNSVMTRLPEWFVDQYGPITGSTMIPITEKPEGIEIVVAGGPGKHSQFFYGGRKMISVSINPWR